MKLIIKNIKNIDDLEVSFEDKKVNFLFGISGTGKSAISEALTFENVEEITQIGRNPDEVSIQIDGQERNIGSFDTYNQNNVERLSLYPIEGEDAYEILFANNDSYLKRLKEFEKSVEKLSNIRKTLLNNKNMIQKLMESQSIKKLTTKSVLPGTSVISRVSKILNDKDKKSVLNQAKTLGLEKTTWIKNGLGFEEFDKNICPFCEQDILEDKRKIIKNIAEIDTVFFKAINEDEKLYHDLNLDKPDYFDQKSLEIQAEVMRKYSIVLSDLNSINNFIDVNDIYDMDVSNFTKIKISEELREIYPEIALVIDEMNLELTQIKKNLSRLKSEMKKTIANNKNEINNQLKLFGIKYKVVEKPLKPNEKKAAFILKHENDQNEIDRSKHLSTGEKNIFALILFLVRTKTKNLIIDDPASSFDSNRRKIIYDLIIKKSTMRTVLLLSHDEVFIKFAVKSKYIDNNDRIGDIKYISNYTGTVVLKDIRIADYATLETFAKKRISLTDNLFLHVINSRLIFEQMDRQEQIDKASYGYLSAIIHDCTDAQIQEEITATGLTELVIISHINNKTGSKLVELSKFDRTIKNIKDFTNFERIFMLREDSERGVTRNEMSDLIHITDRQSICLNPYEFDCFSPYLYERVQNLPELND